MSFKDIEFLVEIAPDLLKFGNDLFHLFKGDAHAAKQEISDRRAEITRRREENDAALKDKYPET
jgi:hypothetical protein